MDPLKDPQLQCLIELLAAVDTLWTPLRHQRGVQNEAPAVAERRTQFRRGGIPWTIGGSATMRQAGNRNLKALAERDIIQLVGRGKNRCIRFTEFGDNFARSFVPTRRIDQAWIVLEIVDTTNKMFDGRSNAGYQLETDILGIDDSENLNGDGGRLVFLEDLSLPLLANGLLESASDARGSLGYRLSEAGQEALEGGKPEEPTGMPEYDSELGKEFTELYCTGLRDRETHWKPENRNHCAIPLSCGRWPRKPEDAPFEFHFQEVRPDA